LIDDSILKNIAFGEKENEINKQRFKESADKAQLSEFIDNLEFKENTIVGENGTKLSGGQKQRIGIARALYKNFDIIIFDESTNALDSVTEDKVISALDKLTPEKTLVIITHKLSTIKNCDLIYEFKDGKITPESLNRT
jgi:ABC-type multidrug transport system fused ATPase/permease subunit